MAHFARLDEDNTVMKVHVVDNRHLLDGEGNESAEQGIAHLQRVHGGGTYKQTSYNTSGGVHRLGGTPLRKNYCWRGWTYHPAPIDGFSPPKPFESWTLDEETCLWQPPVPMPDDAGPDKLYGWNEEAGGWVEIDMIR